MTAEMGIVNKVGVALAADSAATINGGKVFNSATKLFTLSSKHFVGIMIYGNAAYMNIPWSVIIKTFREKIGSDTKEYLKEYLDEFIEYIKTFKVNDSDESQFIQILSNSLLNSLNQRFNMEKVMINNLSNDELVNKITEYLEDIENDLQSRGLSENYFKKLKSKYEGFINSFWINNVDEEVGKKTSDKFVETVFKIFLSDRLSPSETGIVFAGYGSKDIFPQVINISIDGSVCGSLKTVDGERVDGSETNTIMPFAQQEMVHTVMRGIDPDLDIYRQELSDQLRGQIETRFSLSSSKAELQQLFDGAKNMFDDEVKRKHISPVVNMLEVLSLQELGSMAETFVSLTSFKRKFSGDIETVGGPIDVLVISRSDGPIWLKRKKYFDIEMNQGYLNRRK